MPAPTMQTSVSVSAPNGPRPAAAGAPQRGMLVPFPTTAPRSASARRAMTPPRGRLGIGKGCATPLLSEIAGVGGERDRRKRPVDCPICEADVHATEGFYRLPISD